MEPHLVAGPAHLAAAPTSTGTDSSIPSNSAHSAATPSPTGTDVSIPTLSRTWSPGQHTWPPRPVSPELTFSFRATRHTWPPHPASSELTFSFLQGTALGRRASTLGRHTPFLLLTEFLAGEWRYSATHLSGISDAKHACVGLCFQLPSRCSSAWCAHALRQLSAESDRRTDTNEATRTKRTSSGDSSTEVCQMESSDWCALSNREAEEQREGKWKQRTTQACFASLTPHA